MTNLSWPVEIAGRGFNVSRQGNRFGRRSIPVQKAQQDTSALPGEQSLNPADLWRRSFESWHRGAGQEWFDWEGGDKYRFRGSWGVDPWTEKQLGLLNDTERKLASTNSSVLLVAAGDYLYCADGQTLKYTQDILTAGVSTWTPVTGTPTSTITGLVSDGYRIWAAFGQNGIYTTTRGAASATLHHNMSVDSLGYAKGRLMVGTESTLYNVTSAATAVPVMSDLSNTFGTTGVDLEVDLPTNALIGDLLVAVLAWSSAADIRLAPDGWTEITTGSVYDSIATTPQLGYGVYWGVKGAASTATWEFTSDAQNWAATVTALSNADTQDPIVYGGASTFAADTDLLPSTGVTTTSRNSAVLSVMLSQNAGAQLNSFDPPSGFVVQGGTSPGLSPWVEDLVALKVYETAGATGTLTWTKSNNADVYDEMAIINFAVKAAFPDILLTQPSTDFTWVGFAEGQGDIYAAGYSGDKSLIYRTQIRADGTELDAPVVAATLPDGEIVRSIYGYLGILFIGTDSGVRMAISDANGDLTIGALIETPSPVRCFEGQGRFVWFGLEDFDTSRWSGTTVDGLGRLDLTQQTSQLVPAWASDLMVAASTSTTESVQSIASFQGNRVFSIGSSDALSRGVYAENAIKVSAGYLDSGFVTYGISDTKVATYIDLRHKPLVGTVSSHLSSDEGAFLSVGSSTSASSIRPTIDPLSAGPTRGDRFEVRVELQRGEGTDSIGPTLTRVTLRSEPAPSRGLIFQVPLILAKAQKIGTTGRHITRDPSSDLAFIEALFDTQTLITYREDAQTYQVFITDYEFIAEHRTDDGRDEQGILTVTLKRPSS